MFKPLHSLAKRAARLRPFPALVRRRGAALLLDPQNWIDNRLLARAPFEDAQLARAKALIGEHEIDTVLDIGANIGLYSVTLGMMDEVEQVFAFEPVRRNFNQLCANVFANRLDGKVETFRLAASDAAGQARIHIDPASTGIARLDLESAGRDTAVFRHSETIDCARLDDLLDVKGRRLFVKIDVEGHGARALAGMTRILAENEAVIQAELLDADRDAIIAAIDGLGYNLIEEIEADGYFVRTRAS